MTLSIEDKETEALVARIVELTGETETAIVRKGARQRLDRIAAEPKPGPKMTAEELHHWLETEVWPRVPKDVLGKKITKAEREEILGYGPGGF
jgi:antitoxin VapB